MSSESLSWSAPMNPATQTAKLNGVTLSKLAELSALQSTLAKNQARSDELTAALITELFPDGLAGGITDAAGVTVTLCETKGHPEVTEEGLNEIMPLLPVEFRRLGELIEYRPHVVKKGFVKLDLDQRRTFEQACRINVVKSLSIQIPESVRVEKVGKLSVTLDIDTRPARKKLRVLKKQLIKTKRVVKKAVKKASPKKKKTGINWSKVRKQK